jgi:hypothetical protein
MFVFGRVKKPFSVTTFGSERMHKVYVGQTQDSDIIVR